MSSPLSEFESSIESRGVGIGRKVYNHIHGLNYGVELGTNASNHSTWQKPQYRSYMNESQYYNNNKDNVHLNISCTNQYEGNNHGINYQYGNYAVSHCRSRPVPQMTSTPLHVARNGYPNHYSQYSGYNKSYNSKPSSPGLTEVLSSCTPGATTIFLDSKSKCKRKLCSLRTFTILLILFGLSVGIFSWWNTAYDMNSESSNPPVHRRLAQPSIPMPQTYQKPIDMHEDNEIKRQPAKTPSPSTEKSSQEASFKQPNRIDHEKLNFGKTKQDKYKTVIYSFDDKDRDNEAKVEIN